jgi:hypothetical protein
MKVLSITQSVIHFAIMIILLILGILFQFFFFPFQFWADGEVRFNFLMDLISKGIITPLRYPAIGPFVSYPLALIDKLFNSHYWLLRYNLILLIIASCILYVLLKKLIDKRILVLFIVLLFFASMFPAHIIQYYGEVFSVLCMTIGIICIEQKRLAFGWILMVCSVTNMPGTIIPLGIICLYKILWQKKYIYILLPAIALGSLILDAKIRLPRTLYAFNNYLFNDVNATTMMPYSGRPGFSYPMIFGLLSETVSFGKGLLFFAPGLLFIPNVWKTLKSGPLKQIFLLWIIYLISLILLYSKWAAWYGGWFWGPRYLLFASIPASFALAYTLLNKSTSNKLRIFTLVIAGWSLWVGANGVVFGQQGLDICTINNFALEHLCWFVPEFSVLFHPFVTGIHLDIVGMCIIGFNSIVGLFIVRSTLFSKKK